MSPIDKSGRKFDHALVSYKLGCMVVAALQHDWHEVELISKTVTVGMRDGAPCIAAMEELLPTTSAERPQEPAVQYGDVLIHSSARAPEDRTLKGHYAPPLPQSVPLTSENKDG